MTVTRYAESDDLLIETLCALSVQDLGSKLRVLVLDQRESLAVRDFCAKTRMSFVAFDYDVIPAKSLSFARNEAIRRCETSVLLFLDTDAAPRPDWARHLTRALQDEHVGIAGGRILPRWSRPPLLLAHSSLVLEQYSMLDLGMGTSSAERVIGANFGIHLARLRDEAHFDESLGRQKGVLLGGEETDLCRRVKRAGLTVVYTGAATVDHFVPSDRISYRWLARRFYYGGLSRGLQGGRPRPISRRRSLMDWIALAVLGGPYALGLARGRSSRN